MARRLSVRRVATLLLGLFLIVAVVALVDWLLMLAVTSESR
jgi:hypothetical protein